MQGATPPYPHPTPSPEAGYPVSRLDDSGTGPSGAGSGPAFFSAEVLAEVLKGDNMYRCEKCNKLRKGVKYSCVLALPEMLSTCNAAGTTCPIALPA